MLKHLCRAFAGAVAVGIVCAPASFAQRTNYGPVLQYDGGFHVQSVQRTYGWTFDVIEPGFVINYMGVWDEFSDGLVNSHQVGLWQGDTLLRTTTVGPTSGILDENLEWKWRANAIEPLTLGVGSYTLGALYVENDADLFSLGAETVLTIPELIYGVPVRNGNTSFERPTNVVVPSEPGYFGPIIGHRNGDQFDSLASAPEPGSLLLLTLGVAGGGILIRRARR